MVFACLVDTCLCLQVTTTSFSDWSLALRAWSNAPSSLFLTVFEQLPVWLYTYVQVALTPHVPVDWHSLFAESRKLVLSFVLEFFLERLAMMSVIKLNCGMPCLRVILKTFYEWYRSYDGRQDVFPDFRRISSCWSRLIVRPLNRWPNRKFGSSARDCYSISKPLSLLLSSRSHAGRKVDFPALGVSLHVSAD